MKKIIFSLFTICLAILIFSCTKEESSTQRKQMENSTSAAMQVNCDGCDGILDYVVTRVPGQNCLYHFNVIQKPGCTSRAQVYKGGTYMGFAYQVALQGGFYFVGLPTIIKVYGKDPVTGQQIQCFYETYSCKDCCDFATVTKTDLGPDINGCCQTQVTISNSLPSSGSNCTQPLIVKDANGTTVMTIPVGQTVTQIFTQCASAGLEKIYNVTINGAWVCKSFKVTATCSTGPM